MANLPAWPTVPNMNYGLPGGSTQGGFPSGGMTDNQMLAMGLSNTVSGILNGLAQGQMFDRQQAMSGAQLQQNQQQYQGNQQLSREQTGLQATQLDPLAQQRSRQQQAILAAILPQLRNSQASAPQGIPQGQLSGGIMGALPEGGFSPETLGYFSPSARANAEGNYWQNAAPFATPPDLAQLGYGQAGVGPSQAAAGARGKALGDQQLKADQDRQALLAAIQQSRGNNDHSTRNAIIGGIASAAPYLAMLSHSSFKEQVTPVDPDTVLAKLQQLPLHTWHYKGDKIAHIGPMAEEFAHTFGVGDGMTLSLFDVLGVIMAAQQALARRQA